jgi:hypothetical protein
LGQVEDKARGVTKDTWLWTQIERGKLPYDFDRFRIFMWSRQRGSYQTIRLIAGLTGYLPIQVHPELETRWGAGSGFSVIVEEDGQRMVRTYAVVGYILRQVEEKPAPPPLPPIRFAREEPPPAPPPSLWRRLLPWQSG